MSSDASLNYSPNNEMKLNTIATRFQELFKLKGYKMSDTFGPNVWFLKDNKKFQSMLQTQTPFSDMGSCPKVIELVTELNQARDLTSLKVSVSSFIQRISQLLLDSQLAIELSSESIKKNDSLRKYNQINGILQILNKKVEGNKKGNYSSSLQICITNMNNFPSGHYEVSMGINSNFGEGEQNDLNDSEKNNLDKNNPDSVYNLFKEEHLQTKQKIISIPPGKNNISFFVMNNSNENNSINYFDEYKFHLYDIDNQNFLLDKKNSGTTLSTFRVNIKGPNGMYESKNEYFLILILSWVDDLCNIQGNYFSKNLNIKVADKKDRVERTIGLQFEFFIDDLTRIKMLNRIKELLSIPINTQMKDQMLIEEVLTDYFKELNETVKNILNNKEEQRENCCECKFI